MPVHAIDPLQFMWTVPYFVGEPIGDVFDPGVAPDLSGDWWTDQGYMPYPPQFIYLLHDVWSLEPPEAGQPGFDPGVDLFMWTIRLPFMHYTWSLGEFADLPGGGVATILRVAQGLDTETFFPGGKMIHIGGRRRLGGA